MTQDNNVDATGSSKAQSASTVVPASRFWPLIPVAIALGLIFHFFWSDSPLALRAVIGTVAMLVAATVVVLTHRT